MKEHSLIMSSPLIPALLDGRKTQTRRVVAWSNSLVDNTISKWWREHWTGFNFRQARVHFRYPKPLGYHLHVPYSPYRKTIYFPVYPRIQPGDLIWVKETHFQTIDNEGHDKPDISYHEEENNLYPGHWRKVSARFMPRRAARIILRVVGVRAKRLQDISDEDVEAEGAYGPVGAHEWDCRLLGCHFNPDSACDCGSHFPQEVFARLWDNLNAKRGHPWAANDWVWVYDLKQEDV